MCRDRRTTDGERAEPDLGILRNRVLFPEHRYMDACRQLGRTHSYGAFLAYWIISICLTNQYILSRILHTRYQNSWERSYLSLPLQARIYSARTAYFKAHFLQIELTWRIELAACHLTESSGRRPLTYISSFTCWSGCGASVRPYEYITASRRFNSTARERIRSTIS
jgi:hypothetical protein